MPRRYPGGRISKTAPTPTGPFETGTAPGIWSLEEQAQFVKQGIWPTAGLAPPFIEDVFSCFLYTGTSSALTITNGIDLSTKGGLVWTKVRTTTYPHCLTDTIRGGNKQLFSNTTSPSTTSSPAEISSFNTTGYTLEGGSIENISGQNFVGWTFRKQPKFFDMVTYTGNGVNNRTITHSLNSVPGCVIIKRTDAGENWAVSHRGNGTGNAYSSFSLNSTSAGSQGLSQSYATSTTVNVTDITGAGSSPNGCNTSNATYVAYLFAHDAGGFGLSGTDNVISCGSFTTDGSALGQTVNLGYEPQWVLTKESNGVRDWQINDTMRGLPVGADGAYLEPNTSDAETVGGPTLNLTSTGFFQTGNGANATYIYIAIRRGPMKVPTLGTSVFAPVAYAGNSVINRQITTGFTTDAIWRTERFKTSGVAPAFNGNMSDRLANGMLRTNLSDANNPTQAPVVWASNTGVIYPTDNYINNATGSSYILYGLQRAPSFFDEVCYTGVGGTASFNHNLGVVPELIFVKSRSAANGGLVYNKTITASKYLKLFFSGEGHYAVTNDTGGFAGVEPTSSVFTVGFYSNVNTIGATYTAYLFATCAGVSKVGSYTGTGALQTINCGFAAGARFVLIKRTDSTGDWWSYDSARGITSGNDPYLYWNNTDAEVTGTNYVDTTAVGFQVTAAAPAELNANGGTYIFLAIA